MLEARGTRPSPLPGREREDVQEQESQLTLGPRVGKTQLPDAGTEKRQQALREPKVVIFCLDWSASMKSNDTRTAQRVSIVAAMLFDWEPRKRLKRIFQLTQRIA